MKEKYSSPEMEILFSVVEDIICTSGDGSSIEIPGLGDCDEVD